MGFLTSTTSAPGLTELERRQSLGQAMGFIVYGVVLRRLLGSATTQH